MSPTKLKARYFTADGKAGDAHALPEDPFDGVVNEHSIYTTVTAQLANRRQGTASAKTRSAVRGGGRKPWRQKGTGRARHGSIRSPIWRGGGVVFPPAPRSYRQDVPKKVRRLARRSAFNARAAEDRILVVEDLPFEEPRTRQLVKLLAKLGVHGEKVLILTAGHRELVHLSARNVPNLEVRPYGTESAYDIVWSEYVLIEESALSDQDAGAPTVAETASEAADESEADAGPEKAEDDAAEEEADA